MDMDEKTKNIKISIELCNEYLDPIKEIMAKELGVEKEKISYRMVTMNLKKRLDRLGGLKEISKIKR